MVYKKFESIKLNIMKGRKLLPFQTAKVIQDHEDRIKALEAGSSSEGGDVVTYSFTSYADKDGNTTWGTGTAKTTGVTKGNYTQIEVVTNSVEGFAGNKYFIISSAKANGTSIYKLYTDAGNTGADIWVSIEEVN